MDAFGFSGTPRMPLDHVPPRFDDYSDSESNDVRDPFSHYMLLLTRFADV
jgi:hypothetical protein